MEASAHDGPTKAGIHCEYQSVVAHLSYKVQLGSSWQLQFTVHYAYSCQRGGQLFPLLLNIACSVHLQLFFSAVRSLLSYKIAIALIDTLLIKFWENYSDFRTSERKRNVTEENLSFLLSNSYFSYSDQMHASGAWKKQQKCHRIWNECTRKIFM
jgi:hypothetical protein